MPNIKDRDGKIIRSKKWLQNRIAALKFKDAEYAVRSENIKKEILERKEELEKITE